MNLIDQTANRITLFIRTHYEHAASEKVLFYSLSLLLNTTLALTAVLSVSLITGHFVEALLTIACFFPLRYLTGGFHLHSSVACCLFSIALLTTVIHASFDFMYLGLLFTVISMMIFWKKAPNGIENISRIAPKYYPLLKYSSMILVFTNLFIQSPLLSAVFIAQAFTLTDTGYWIVNKLERR